MILQAFIIAIFFQQGDDTDLAFFGDISDSSIGNSRIIFYSISEIRVPNFLTYDFIGHHHCSICFYGRVCDFGVGFKYNGNKQLKKVFLSLTILSTLLTLIFILNSAANFYFIRRKSQQSSTMMSDNLEEWTLKSKNNPVNDVFLSGRLRNRDPANDIILYR